MATATTSAPDEQRGPSTADARAFWKAAAMKFEAYEENSGRYRWQLVASDGRRLAISCESYPSCHDAERAAGYLHDGAAGSRPGGRRSDEER